jgi:hypothetical protein
MKKFFTGLLIGLILGISFTWYWSVFLDKETICSRLELEGNITELIKQKCM